MKKEPLSSKRNFKIEPMCDESNLKKEPLHNRRNLRLKPICIGRNLNIEPMQWQRKEINERATIADGRQGRSHYGG